MANINFVPEEITGNFVGKREPLPAGAYRMIVAASEIKTTQAGTGQFLELELQVIDGEHSGRRLWDRLNISNPNPKAEQIAKANLSRLCAAVGVKHLTDTAQLHNKPVLVDVQIDRKEPDRNRIMLYARAAGVDLPATPSAPASARPWERSHG